MGLDTVELVMHFEEEFEIDIPDAVAEKMVTVGDVVEFVALTFARIGRPADRQDIFERVRKRTGDIADVDPSRISLDTRFVADLGLD